MVQMLKLFGCRRCVSAIPNEHTIGKALSTSKNWSSRLGEFKKSDNPRAAFEIAVTVVPLVILWFALWKSLQANSFAGYVSYALLLIVAGGMIVRLFILQHDCGHGSLFSSKKVNDWVGRVLGIFSYTPYAYWRYMHAAHHAGSGDLDRRGLGDIDTLTLSEYNALGSIKKLQYRFYRNPFILFLVGPFYMFVLRHRLPICLMKDQTAWKSVMGTNVGIFLVAIVLSSLVGFKTFLLIQIPIVTVGAAIGVWLFYVQHQFDETYWETRPEWTHEQAALHGSSFYDLPKPFMWLTGNIGIHHVHHLSSRIPFYKLPTVLKAHPELKNVSRLKFVESLKCIRLALWDEASRRLISFKEAGQLTTAGQIA